VAQGATVCQYIGALMFPSAKRQRLPGTVGQEYFNYFSLIFFRVRSALHLAQGAFVSTGELKVR
jgi:hypothetical protein